MVIAGLVLASLLAVGVIATAALRGGDGLPASIDGLERLHTPEARQFEKVLSQTHAFGVSVEGATYGTPEGTSALLIVEVFEGLPSGIPLDPVMQAFASAAAGTAGGTIDDSTSATQTRDGVAYSCVRMQGSDTGPTGATLCLWDGDPFGAVVDLRSGDTTAAIDTAQEIHDSLS